MKSVTIYTGPLYAFCDAAKKLLTRNNVEYKEIDISTVDGAMDEMITILGVPGVINRNKIICKKRK